AQQIASQAGRVYDKLRGVVEKMEKLGRQLDTAKNSYDEAWSSLKSGRGNLVAQSEKFRELGVRVKKELPRHLVEEADPAHHLGDGDDQPDNGQTGPDKAIEKSE
ncbi:MAG: DNA recombination protein RmuC, partial [Gammaproteobacteria bacterium]